MSLLSESLERHLRELQNPTPVEPKAPVVTQVQAPDKDCKPFWNRSVVLYFREGTSDKIYQIQIVQATKTSDYFVKFQYGRRGGTYQQGTKTPYPVDLYEAEQIYQKLLHEKLAKGYATQP